MKRTYVELASIFGLALLSQNVSADTLVGPGGAFQQWTSAVLGPVNNPTYGGPYWNNVSGDGPTYNIGWCLVGGGGCVIASPPGAIAFWGSGNSAVANMSIQNNGTPVTVSLVGMFTNQLGTPQNSGYNLFGWYQINANGTIGALTTLWNSKSAAVGDSSTFTPTGNYGLFLENIQGNGQSDYFWFMNKTQDYSGGTYPHNPVDSAQHFAVFGGTPGQYFVGIDDTNNGNDDYNDMIVKLTNAPEPSALFLSGLSLLICCGYSSSKDQRARRRAAKLG
jgi:hypothetical protein